MNNFDIAEQALETSLNSAGSAMKEHEKWQQSLEAQILKLKAAWQGLSQAFLTSDFLKSALSAVIALVDGLTALIDTIGAIPTLLGVFAGLKTLISIPRMIGKTGGLSGIKGLKDILTALQLAFPLTSKGVSKLTTALKGMAAAGGGVKGVLTGLLGLLVKHPIIAAAAAAVATLTWAFTHQKKKAEELSKEVDEVISSYKEQHGELKKLKNDYDTSNEDSMISKYAALSRGVDGLGRNVSLTADEYSEYQGIVNKIAEQIPSLISGYDEQGNALLSCKDNVEALTDAYQNLVHAQNQDVLTNAGKIEEDFANVLEKQSGEHWWTNGHGFWKALDFFHLADYELKTDTVKILEDLLGAKNETERGQVLDYLRSLGSAHYSDAEIRTALEGAGIDVAWNENVYDVLEETLKADPSKIKGIVDNYYTQFAEIIEQQKTIGRAKLSEAFDISNVISGLNYGNISEELQSIAYQVVNSLDFDFFSQLSESCINFETWVTEMLNQLNSIGKEDNAQIEMGFELQTKFNGGEMSYGEYVGNLSNIEDIIDRLNLKPEVKEQLKISLGLDEDGIVDQYDALIKRLTDSKNYDFNITEDEAREFLDGLSAEELPIAVDIITKLSNNNVDETADELQAYLDRELALQKLTIDLDIEVEKTKLEALSTAISESVSGMGLSEESISAVEGIFEGLASYDPSELFERTAHGVRLNSDELRRLSSEYKNMKIGEIREEMSDLADIYDQTSKELDMLTYGTEEYDEKVADLNSIESRINELERLAAGYEGVASAYQEWQMYEAAGSQRDMYEGVIEGFENIDDEISRGWVDDGTIKFLELLTGKDLSTSSIKEIKSAYESLGTTIDGTTYKVRDFFTVNDEGESTNTGVYNFLDAIDEKFKNSEVIQRSEDGNIIGFNFDVVGGDKAIAEALGISEELVQIMVRAADDAGFVVDMDGNWQQLDALKENAQKAAETLKSILGEDTYDFNFNVSSVEDITTQLDEAKKILDTFKNADGTIDTSIKGADEALTVAKTLQSMLDKLTRPAYMDIQTSQVEEGLRGTLANLQDYRTQIERLNQAKLSGVDTAELEASVEEAKNKAVEDLMEIQNTNPELAVELGIEGLTKEEIAAKVEAGEITIPATVDIQLEMSEQLGILVDKALLDAGLISEEEFEKRVKIYLDADVDNEDAKNETERVVDDVIKSSEFTKGDGGETKEIKFEADVEVGAGEIDTSDVDSEIEKHISSSGRGHGGHSGSFEVVKEADVKVGAGEIDTSDVNEELEVTIKEGADLIQKFEDKDITIDAKVKNLDDVKELSQNVNELNQNIDLTTKIEGSVEKLSEYVDGARELSELDDNITSYVTANVSGNVTETKEFKLNNLKVFSDSAEDLKDVGTFTSSVVADIHGNVKDTPEFAINNLKVFSDSAKGVEDIGEVEASVTANIDGDVIWHPEGMLNNLKVFVESAEAVRDIGNIEASVTANIDGDVIWTPEGMLNNLKEFSESAETIKDTGTVEAKVTANIDGDVIWHPEGMLNNLKEFSEGAEAIKDIGNIEASIVANIDGDAIWHPEGMLNNLKTFAEGAKEIKDVGEVEAKITANIDGDVVWHPEAMLNNLETFAEGARELDDIGDVSASVTADINGDAVWHPEGMLNNLNAFADGAESIKSVGDVSASVTANISGDVVWHPEGMLNNLGTFADGAREIEGIGDVSSTVTANIDGDVIWTPEGMLNNLEVYAENAKELDGIGDVESNIVADIGGNVIWTPEGMINNLETYTDCAKKLDSVGDISSSVVADISGNVINTTESKINNLGVFADNATELKGTGNFTSSVSANVNGNVINTPESSIDNLGVFADNANKLKSTGNFTSSVSANVSGNVITDDTAVTDLEHFASIVSGMTNQTVTVSVTANVDSTNINQAITLLTNVANSGVFKDYKATVQVGAEIATIDDTTVKNYKAPPKEGKVKYGVDSSKVDSWKAPPKTGTVTYKPKISSLTYDQLNKTGTITYKANIVGLGPAAGTAHANGSAKGRAFARGDWGIKGNGVALGGELGREIVVRDGKFFTIGDEGAEFFRYKKNDIVFNATQSEALFKYGGLKGANSRGKMLASGTAFAEGNAFSIGTGGWGSVGGVASKVSVGKSYSKSSGSDNGDEPREEVFDWIEIAIDRIERAIDQLDTKVNSVYRTWSERNNSLAKEISYIRDEINLQQRAYDGYISAANSIGLSSDWAKKVRNGEINIDTVTDEALAEKIKDYQEYYEKALDCKDAILELKEAESELYKQRFDNASTQYEGILGTIEHEKNMLEEYINQSEAQAWLVSSKYYDALASNEKENIAELKKQKNAMIAEFNSAINSGAIAKGSEAYYEMVGAIDEVTLAITEGQTALLEYAQTIQQLKWEQFDLLQDKISSITEETEFLIDLMSNDKLFDDNGQLTDEGMATMGLHGVAYNVYMAQADQAAEEAARLKKELSKDPYDTELEERYREMIALQQEYILAAEDEKNAIRDLVEEGINLELEALDERIEKYKDALDEERAFYEYQKKVAEQTKEIASLEKQISAYEGDDSEETKAKIQQLKVDLENARAELEEAEYDKYISDQQKLLDDLYLEYEIIFNQRLDNIDALIFDVITEINNNAGVIGNTIVESANSVGYTLSDSMQTIWNNSTTSTNNVIAMYGEKFAMYGDKFSTAQTTTNTALNTVNSNLQSILSKLNSMAKANESSSSTSSYGSSFVGRPSSNSSSSSSNSPSYIVPYPSTSGSGSSGASGNISVGSRIYAGGAKIYEFAGSTSGMKQYYSNDPVYIVVQEQGGYVLARHHSLSGGYTGWFRKSDVSAYKTGAKRIASDEMAWTQEEGTEFIIRPSDGAILTPVSKGDKIFNANASNNLWNMANSPSEFIKDNLNLSAANAPDNSNSHNNYTQHLDKVIFNLPNVKNYEELLSAMQKDPKFEKLILSMSIDRIAGKSGLAKGKTIR